MAKSNLELTDVLSAPLGDFISSIAKGVAEAQQSMDEHTIETFRSVYMGDEQMLEELRQLGYQPTWYKIPELSAEINMALTINATSLEAGSGTSINRANKFELLAAPVDASFVNSFNYDIQGSSKVKFTIVPVPPSAQAENIKVVPFLEGKTLQEAIDLLTLLDVPHQIGTAEENGLSITETKAEDIAPSLLSDLIVSVGPVAGTILAKGQKVTLVATGSPDLINKTVQEATDLLTSLNIPFRFADGFEEDSSSEGRKLILSNLTINDLSQAQLESIVQEMEPRAGSMLTKDQVITIVLPSLISS